MSQQPASAYGHDPHAENAHAHRVPDVSGGGEAAGHDDIDGPPDLKTELHIKDLPAQRVDHRIIGEDAVNGIAENEDQQCQQLGGRQRDADGGPDTAADLVQLPAADHVAQNDLGGLPHGDGVHIGHVGQHTAIDLGADHRRTHQIDETEDEGLGYVVGQGLCTGGQGDAQQGAEGLCGEGVQILQGKTDGAFAFRSRKKEQFRAHGLDAFADHEVLELLLYYAVPRQDTNPIAHRLMEKFGSLDAVFAADRAALEEVEGIGENASTLISLMFPLMRRIRASSGVHETILSDTEQAGAYFLDLFLGEREEKLYEACLDAKGRLLACHLVAEGDTESVQLNMRKIVENALKCGASSVLLSHNHPSGVALPSPADNATTLSVFDALRTVGVELADHIIVADDDFVSLRHNGLLPERKGNGYGI